MLEKKQWDFGDVKFMGAVGLYFGATAIAEISLAAFFIAAIISILILIYRSFKKNKDEYVPFGPFLVLATFLVIFVGDGVVIRYFLGFCKLISDKIIGI
ncbi:MAG: hypothetical protein HFJ45_03290 [Clostridia bacterium]|nr:hypothetical protein [Clostridia bacterium]